MSLPVPRQNKVRACGKSIPLPSLPRLSSPTQTQKRRKSTRKATSPSLPCRYLSFRPKALTVADEDIVNSEVKREQMIRLSALQV